MKKNKFFIGILILYFTFGCEKVDNSNNDFIYFDYGTSFGECWGYCHNSIKVSESNIEFRKSGIALNNTPLPLVVFTETINKNYWNALVESTEFESFLLLDSVIGCPDCADGGAEMLEIKKGTKKHLVTFEYWYSPELIVEPINLLRTYLLAFEVNSSELVDFDNRVLIKKFGKIKKFTCSSNCDQYLIEYATNQTVSYYFDRYLENVNKIDGLEIYFNGVLQYDSTMIYKPGENDVQIPNFKARNIKTIDLKTVLR